MPVVPVSGVTVLQAVPTVLAGCRACIEVVVPCYGDHRTHLHACLLVVDSDMVCQIKFPCILIFKILFL